MGLPQGSLILLDDMLRITVADSAMELGRLAAEKISEGISEAVRERGTARIVLSTGKSQFDTLSALTKMDLPWDRVEMFHLDEYAGISPDHPASFRRYLNERFVSLVHPGIVHFVSEDDVEKLSAEFRKAPVDVGVIGIGENGHIAFNDPPADFDTDDVFRIVTLDRRCREQQVGEGWFRTVDDVPPKAVTMCPRAILSARMIVSAVPYSVKAEAVRRTILNKVDPMVPATLLKTHPDWNLFLDRDSASQLLG